MNSTRRVQLSALAVIGIGAAALAAPEPASAKEVDCYYCLASSETCLMQNPQGYCTSQCPEKPSGVCVDEFVLCPSQGAAVVCDYET